MTDYMAIFYDDLGKAIRFTSHNYAEAVEAANNHCEEGREIKVYEVQYDALNEPQIFGLVAVFNSPMKEVV